MYNPGRGTSKKGDITMTTTTTTIKDIKALIETMLPDGWEYCHDCYVAENFDFDGVIADGMTDTEIAKAAIEFAISEEKHAFEMACKDALGADGVEVEDGEVYISDEFYTEAHRRELEQIAYGDLVEQAEEAREAALEYEWLRRESYKW